MSATLGYGQVGSSGLVSLGGHSVTFTDGGLKAARDVAWPLPDAVLNPGVSYRVWLSGGSVGVVADG